MKLTISLFPNDKRRKLPEREDLHHPRPKREWNCASAQQILGEGAKKDNILDCTALFSQWPLETGPKSPGWGEGFRSKAGLSRITVHSIPSRTAPKMAVALATTPWETAWTSLGTALRTTRWASAPPPTLSDSPLLPATRVSWPL